MRSYSFISNEFAGSCFTMIEDVAMATTPSVRNSRPSMEGVPIRGSRSGKIKWGQYSTVTTTPNVKRLTLPLVHSMTILSNGGKWRDIVGVFMVIDVNPIPGVILLTQSRGVNIIKDYNIAFCLNFFNLISNHKYRMKI